MVVVVVVVVVLVSVLVPQSLVLVAVGLVSTALVARFAQVMLLGDNGLNLLKTNQHDGEAHGYWDRFRAQAAT